MQTYKIKNIEHHDGFLYLKMLFVLSGFSMK